MTDQNQNGILDNIETKIELDKASVRKQLVRRTFNFTCFLVLACLMIVVFRPDLASALDSIGEILITAVFSGFGIVGAYIGVEGWQNGITRRDQLKRSISSDGGNQRIPDDSDF